MKLILAFVACAFLVVNQAQAAERLGESCAGMETVQIASNPPKQVPFSVTLSMDLTSQTYCYAACLPSQTYAIRDAKSDPISLADMHAGSQSAVMTFDRRTAMLTYIQTFDAGLGRIARQGRVQCHASQYHQPAVRGRVHAR